MSEPPILIVGAGPTGLVLALWLTRLGTKVRIIDKAAAPGTASRALAVQVRTLEFYRQLGIADAVIAAGVKIERLNFWIKGRRAVHIPLSRIGAALSPYPFPLVYPQDDHERLLIEQLEALGVSVQRPTELIDFEEHAGGMRAVLRHGDGSQEICQTAYLAGCDGASSTVRRQLEIGFPGGTYEQLFYVADVVAEGQAVDGQLHVDLEDAEFLLVFPMKGQGRVRLVGVAHQPKDDEFSFDDVKGRAIEHLKLSVDQVNWFSTYRVHHRVASRFRDGHVFLLGDAAHIHSPVGGQGMNTGIGDAVNLAWKLAAVLRGASAESLLASYEPERIRFAQRLVATTDRLFTVVSKPGGLARLLRTQAVPRLAPWLFRLSAVRRFLFRVVSQTGVHYRHSALSAGSAGRVHGGDRLPWVELGPGEDNFAPLASLAWQAHIYGEPPRGMDQACAQLGLPLHCFAWQPAMENAGLAAGALYLIRPDGYVALADPQPQPARLHDYFEQHRLSASEDVRTGKPTGGA